MDPLGRSLGSPGFWAERWWADGFFAFGSQQCIDKERVYTSKYGFHNMLQAREMRKHRSSSVLVRFLFGLIPVLVGFGIGGSLSHPVPPVPVLPVPVATRKMKKVNRPRRTCTSLFKSSRYHHRIPRANLPP